LLEKPEKHPALATRVHVDIANETGPVEAAPKGIDFDDLAAGGAALYVTSDKVRFSLGAPKTPAWMTPDAPLATPKLFLEAAVPSGNDRPDARVALAPNDWRIELLVPRVALLSGVTAKDTSIEVKELSLEPGGPLKFVFSSTLRDAPRSFRVEITVDTYVRDRTSSVPRMTPTNAAR
jgi:hypothetical protein